MNGNMRPQPFTCYFCNKRIENETNEGHMTTCGAVLEPCPNKCGSYIERRMKSRHLKDCHNKQTQTLPRLRKQERFDLADSGPIPGQFNSYNPVSSPGMSTSSDSQMLRPIYTDITKVTNRLTVLEAQIQQVHKNCELLRSRQEKMQTQQGPSPQITSQLDSLMYQNQHITEWRKTIDQELNNIRYETSLYGRNKAEFENRTLTLENKLISIQSMQGEINSLRETLVQEQISSRETRSDIKTHLQKLEDFHAQENATIAGLWTDHGKQIEYVRDSVTSTNKVLEEQRLKQSTIVFDLRAITQISTENAEKLEIQERELEEIRKTMTQIKLDLEILEDSQLANYFTKPGHLIWKMTDFKMKMESAKSNDVILRSPIFYTHEYGYKIRLIVYLNGIKKWKGRHMIACFHVLKGEYDLMLPWPCLIEGNIIIRDLYDSANPRHTTKVITAKREQGDETNEDPQESSTQYMFIPHTTLTKYNHIREDTLFLEIKITKTHKYKEETSL